MTRKARFGRNCRKGDTKGGKTNEADRLAAVADLKSENLRRGLARVFCLTRLA